VTQDNTNTLVSVYSSNILLNQQTKYSIFNFEATDQTINIKLTSTANLTQNIVSMETANSPPLFLAAFDKDTSSGYM
jgi:hypothetical protein